MSKYTVLRKSVALTLNAKGVRQKVETFYVTEFTPVIVTETVEQNRNLRNLKLNFKTLTETESPLPGHVSS